MTFIINNWDDNYENNRTRSLQKLSWVPFPNSHDGDGYTELVDHKNGAAHLGAFVVMVQVASKCHPRGTLVRSNEKPHDSASLSRMTKLPKSIFDETIPRLLLIGWIDEIGLKTEVLKESVTIPHPSAVEPHSSVPERKKERSIVEQVLDCLNSICQTSYKSSTKKTVSLIEARISEKFTFEDFKKVISKKHKEWINTDFAQYLRPETLFGNKFEGYLNQKEETNSQDQTNSRIMI